MFFFYTSNLPSQSPMSIMSLIPSHSPTLLATGGTQAPGLPARQWCFMGIPSPPGQPSWLAPMDVTCRWYPATRRHLRWFVALLLVNPFCRLDVEYGLMVCGWWASYSKIYLWILWRLYHVHSGKQHTDAPQVSKTWGMSWHVFACGDVSKLRLQESSRRYLIQADNKFDIRVQIIYYKKWLKLLHILHQHLFYAICKYMFSSPLYPLSLSAAQTEFPNILALTPRWPSWRLWLPEAWWPDMVPWAVTHHDLTSTQTRWWHLGLFTMASSEEHDEFPS